MVANSSDRIAMLARQKSPIFHTQDLARLWNIENRNTLYTMLKRYTQRGLLFRVYKGLYSFIPIEKIDPLLLGIKALHGYAYVSTETVLVREGIITQVIYSYTLIGSHSRHFQVGSYHFKSRKLKDEYLYNSSGIMEANGILMATPERAIADLLYFNPKAYFDGMKVVNFDEIRRLQKEIGYPLTPAPHASAP